MFLDFKTIKEENRIEQVAERLGLTLKKSGTQLRGKCPVCEGDSDRNLVITPEKGVYFCFSDGKGGDLIQLTAHIRQCAVKDAAAWLSNTPKREPEPKERAGDEQSSEEGFKPLTYLQADHPAVVALGFEPEDAERLGIGYCPRGIYKGKVAIPVRLANGRLVGYVAVIEVDLPPRWNY